MRKLLVCFFSHHKQVHKSTFIDTCVLYTSSSTRDSGWYSASEPHCHLEAAPNAGVWCLWDPLPHNHLVKRRTSRVYFAASLATTINVVLVDDMFYSYLQWGINITDVLKWFLCTQVDTPGVYLQNGNRMLRIYRVQPEHAGRFSCTAQNSAGEARREYSIVVQGKHIKQPPLMTHTLTMFTSQPNIPPFMTS